MFNNFLQKGKPLKPGTKVVLRPKRVRENQFTAYESPANGVSNGHAFTNNAASLKQSSMPSGFTINEEGT